MVDDAPNVEARLRALEERVHLMSQSLDAMARRFPANGDVSGPALASPLPAIPGVDSAVLSHEPSADSSFDRFLRGGLLTRLATVCFLLVAALVLRLITENGLIPPSLGATAGITYCFVLVIGCLTPVGRAHVNGLTFGVCGLSLLCVVVFETYRYLHGLTLFASFLILMAGMVASVLIAAAHKTPVAGWMGLTGAPAVFLALMYPDISYELACVLLLVATAVTFARCSALGLWPARVGLGGLVFLCLFKWNAEQNVLLRAEGTGGYGFSLLFVLACLGFTLLFMVPSLVSAVQRRPLSVYERVTPSVAVLLAYYFTGSELGRWGVEGTPDGRVALMISSILLALGVWFGLRDRVGHCGLRTFLCAGVTLLLLGSYSAVHSAAYLTVLWSVCALALFSLAFYFRVRSADLRFMSYVLHVMVFCVAAIGGALSSVGAFAPGATLISLFLAASTFAHYIGSRMSALRDSDGQTFWIDRSSVAVFVCSAASAFFFGTNVLVAAGGSRAVVTCGQSVWLTVMAASILLAGNRRGNREVMSLGLLVFCAAAVKVFLLDLFQGTTGHIVVSIFTFGALAGVSSYFLHREREKRA